MEWILENLAKLLPVLLAVLYFWLSSKRKRPNAEEAEDADGSDEAERARRIQEEIRRRILERQQGESGPTVEPPVLVEESLHQAQERQVRPAEHGDLHEFPHGGFKVTEPGDEQQRILERQARLRERLEQARRLAASRAQPASQATSGAARPGRRSRQTNSVDRQFNPLRNSLLDDLRGRAGLKRAVLLREVLGEPVGLKQGPLPQK